MTDHFQARASLSVEDITDLFVPSKLGVGVLERERGEQEALIGVHVVGNYVGIAEDTDLMLVLDAERAVGLIIQLRAMLLEAGVNGGKVIRMMKEAYARYDDLRSLDRAPREES